MSKPIAVEQVAVHDRIVVWFKEADSPEVLVVSKIVPGQCSTTLHVCHEGQPIQITVPKGHTVDIAC